MNCERARRDSLAESHTGRNSAAAAHLSQCGTCRQWSEEQRRLQAVLSSWRVEAGAGEGSESEEFLQRLRQRIAAAEAEAGWAQGLRRWWQANRAGALLWRPLQVAGWAALVVVMVGVGALVHFNTSEPPPPPPLQARIVPSAVQDLQVMNHYGELLENLDFLSAPSDSDSGGPH